MSVFRRVLRRGDGAEPAGTPVVVDAEHRQSQLAELEEALDRIVTAMKERHDLAANPGWAERIAEYSRLCGQAYLLRTQGCDREQLLDLAFDIRPVFSGQPPAGFEAFVALQSRAMGAADALREVLPGERVAEQP